MNAIPRIVLGSNAITIADDILSITAVNASYFAPWNNLNDIRDETTFSKTYITLEPSFWLLGGDFVFMPTNVIAAHAGVWSNLQSPADTNFVNIPEIVIQFNSLHSTVNGLTIKFSELSDEYIDYIRIVFYNAGVTILDASYNPASNIFETNTAINNFDKILIGLHSTNKAYRWARLKSVSMDDQVIFSGSSVLKCNMVEQIDPIALTLPSNTIDFSLLSTTGAFDVLNPTGIYADLQYKEPINVYEVVDGIPTFMGRFYLDNWESESINIANFTASDAISLLDKPKYLGGLFGSPIIDWATLVGDILDTAGIAYAIDGSLPTSTSKVDGWLTPYISCREALQQTLLYRGAYATCARAKIINILPLPATPGLTGNDYDDIDTAHKALLSPITLKKFVTGVDLHDWSYDSDNAPTGEILYSGTLGTGTRTIILGEGSKLPSGLTLGGTATYTITTNRYFYVIVNITVAGTVILTQNEGLTITENIVKIRNGSLPANTEENVITVDEATLMTTAAVSNTIATSTIAQRIYDYYQRRYIQKTKLFGSFISTGNSALVTPRTGTKKISGIVEKNEIDLKGLISNVEIVGNVY